MRRPCRPIDAEEWKTRVRRISAITLLLLFGPVSVAGSLNLYEWLATAPVVVTGTNVMTYGKYTDFTVDSELRGEMAPGTVFRVNVRRANRDRVRQLDKKALRFDEGRSYVLLLTPAAKQPADAPPTFEFVRGVRGAREIPLEGAAVLLEAVARFVAIQERNDDGYTWRELSRMVEGTNPLLLETALDLFIKFRRGRFDQLGALRPLLDHPSESLRERTALLIGQILDRQREQPVPHRELLQSELVARARRDSAVSVRVAATRALYGLGGETVHDVLKEIAREDPDQNVRYTAERLLYEGRPGNVETD